MIRDADGGWHCSHCGHDLKIERLAAMELVLKLSDLPGETFSGAGMTPEAMALYIRTLELRWMADQRKIRLLTRQIARSGVQPATEYLQEVSG